MVAVVIRACGIDRITRLCSQRATGMRSLGFREALKNTEMLLIESWHIFCFQSKATAIVDAMLGGISASAVNGYFLAT